MSEGWILIAEVYLGTFQMSIVELFNKNRLPLKTVDSENFFVDDFRWLKDVSS